MFSCFQRPGSLFLPRELTDLFRFCVAKESLQPYVLVHISFTVLVWSSIAFLLYHFLFHSLKGCFIILAQIVITSCLLFTILVHISITW